VTSFDSYPGLAGWKFLVEEVSAGVYRVIGMDEAGRRAETKGLDPDELLNKYFEDALIECRRGHLRS
jgi:hypothetical protein